ncbi:hypothetical protein G9444_6558 (plasmid) [Rhodococcus erythropolis]|uniref:Uncharacterized protein n=1 Tax=Rhodococcus erythropolis TaxID=1833 RepID=A0A6G9D4N9_RHOER|nr:hypothetical protein G9444_6558 [Rhodococcus erythropolis]
MPAVRFGFEKASGGVVHRCDVVASKAFRTPSEPVST